MKRIVIFLLFLCVHLLGVYNYAQASTQKNGVSGSLNATTKSLLVEAIKASRDYVITTNNGLATDCPYVITVENENEEDAIKKHTALTKYLVAFYYSFILTEDYSYNNNCSFDKHLAYLGTNKYIVQRVLRI